MKQRCPACFSGCENGYRRMWDCQADNNNQHCWLYSITASCSGTSCRVWICSLGHHWLIPVVKVWSSLQTTTGWVIRPVKRCLWNDLLYSPVKPGHRTNQKRCRPYISSMLWDHRYKALDIIAPVFVSTCFSHFTQLQTDLSRDMCHLLSHPRSTLFIWMSEEKTI